MPISMRHSKATIERNVVRDSVTCEFFVATATWERGGRVLSCERATAFDFDCFSNSITTDVAG